QAVLTLGGQGAVMAEAGGAWRAFPPQIEPLSAIGSGDAFLAGLLSALKRGESAPEALRCAAAAGAANALLPGSGFFKLEDYHELRKAVRVERLP
ncbi:MAG: PfkB family carbohydrate kinase, partial [Chloroflexi bacterium]|nr:PfkB family carbohydrate kinase [Chloroflexota bacterium]